MSGSRVGSGINVGGLTFVDTFQILSKLGTTIGRPLQKNSSFTLHSSDTNIHFSGLFFASGTFILETSIDFENCSIYVFFIWKSMFVYHRQYIVHNLCLFRFFLWAHLSFTEIIFFGLFLFKQEKIVLKKSDFKVFEKWNLSIIGCNYVSSWNYLEWEKKFLGAIGFCLTVPLFDFRMIFCILNLFGIEPLLRHWNS